MEDATLSETALPPQTANAEAGVDCLEAATLRTPNTACGSYTDDQLSKLMQKQASAAQSVPLISAFWSRLASVRCCQDGRMPCLACLCIGGTLCTGLLEAY